MLVILEDHAFWNDLGENEYDAEYIKIPQEKIPHESDQLADTLNSDANGLNV